MKLEFDVPDDSEAGELLRAYGNENGRGRSEERARRLGISAGGQRQAAGAVGSRATAGQRSGALRAGASHPRAHVCCTPSRNGQLPIRLIG